MVGAAPSGELFPTRASEAEGLVRLLERLRARLGDGQVQRLQPLADHRPERASRSVPAQGRVPATGATVGRRPSASPLPHHRPAWLLPEPLPLAERGALPLLEGRPLQLVSGPERIEAGWWDGAPAVRDYFIAQAEDGSLVWLYRGRLPAAAGEAGWFLQGVLPDPDSASHRDVVARGASSGGGEGVGIGHRTHFVAARHAARPGRRVRQSGRCGSAAPAHGRRRGPCRKSRRARRRWRR